MSGADSATRAVAEFVAGVTPSTVSPVLANHARMSVLDLLGCVIVGASSEHAAHYRRFFATLGNGDEASIAGEARRSSASTAAMANGTWAHATELSETFTRAVVHPGNVIIPAVLAVAEREGVSGARVVSAVATGYEVLIRTGLAVGRPFMLQQGFHIPATTGAFGATVALANLLDLDPAAIADALGVVACMVPTSLMVAAKDGASVKDLFEGQASATGVMAVDLQRAGLTGIQDGLDVWGAAMSKTFTTDPLRDGLGSEWKALSGGLHFKERALLAMGQPAFDAARAIWEREPVDRESISRIVVETSARSSLGGMVHPNNTVSAKASIPFVVAVSLAYPQLIVDDPHFVRSLTSELLDDPVVARLADLVDVRVDEQIDRDFEVSWPMKFAARVTLELSDGTSRDAYEDIWPRTSTFSYADVEAKFVDITRGLLGADAIEEIARQVERLDELDTVDSIMSRVRQVRTGG